MSNRLHLTSHLVNVNTQKLGLLGKQSAGRARHAEKKTRATYLAIAMGDLIRPVVGARSES